MGKTGEHGGERLERANEKERQDQQSELKDELTRRAEIRLEPDLLPCTSTPRLLISYPVIHVCNHTSSPRLHRAHTQTRTHTCMLIPTAANTHR